MEFSFTIRVANGHLGIEGPIDNVPLCLNLMADAMRVLAQRMVQNQKKEQPGKPTLYLSDGSPAPQSSVN